MVSQLASSPIDAKLIYVQKYYETQEALEKEKETFKTKEAIFKRKENELREKDLKIQESLIKFSKYLEENEIKYALLTILLENTKLKKKRNLKARK